MTHKQAAISIAILDLIDKGATVKDAVNAVFRDPKAFDRMAGEIYHALRAKAA